MNLVRIQKAFVLWRLISALNRTRGAERVPRDPRERSPMLAGCRALLFDSDGHHPFEKVHTIHRTWNREKGNSGIATVEITPSRLNETLGLCCCLRFLDGCYELSSGHIAHIQK